MHGAQLLFYESRSTSCIVNTLGLGTQESSDNIATYLTYLYFLSKTEFPAVYLGSAQVYILTPKQWVLVPPVGTD